MIDSFASLICLMFLLTMPEMNAYAKNVKIIENQTVLIRNKYINGYLVRAGPYDHERRHVSVTKDIISNRQLTIEGGLNGNIGQLGGANFGLSSQVPLDYSYDDAKWNLVSLGDGKYEIIHSAFNEPLYAASNEFAYDHDRRRVFTWDHGPSVTQGYWRFEDAGNGYYKIKNTAHGEYLYAAAYPSKGWVFTWRPHYYDSDDVDNDKFYWQILKA